MNGPLSLRLTANFPVSRLMFILIDPESGLEWVLAESSDPSAAHRWFPGPERNGSWQLALAAWEADGTLHRTNPSPACSTSCRTARAGRWR